MKISTIFWLFFSVLFLGACGGGSSSGSADTVASSTSSDTSSTDNSSTDDTTTTDDTTSTDDSSSDDTNAADDTTSTDDTSATNTAPTISTPASQSVNEGVFYVATVEATDVDADTLSYAVSGTDAASLEIDSSGLLSFISVPDYETQSSYSVTVSVSDGTDSTSLEMDIAIVDIASEIVIASAALKSTGGATLKLPLNYTCYGSTGGVSPLISWSGGPSESDGASYYAVTMHAEDANGDDDPNFTVFDVAASTSSLPSGDFSVGTAAEGDMTAAEIEAAGGQAYSAPCAAGAGTLTSYYVSIYVLSDALGLDSTATRATFLTELKSEKLLTSTQLTLNRVSYDAASIASDLHVPASVPSTCAEKTEDFSEYSRMWSSLTCNEDNNEIVVSSNWDSGLKTALSDQQIGVGTNSWIGRLALPSATGVSIRLQPEFLEGVNNNMACDGVDTLGITVDGQPILPYYKQGGTGSGFVCGPTDGDDYRNRDTVLTGEVDQCYGHSPNGEGYHMHGAPVCLMDIHDPSEPIAYMVDGIPLYFGQGGGTLDSSADASAVSYATTTNYGAGLYEHLDYRPSDVKDGTNPLNECNAYDINQDGTVSGFVYYSTKEAPYVIGCFQGSKLTSPSSVGGGTKLLSARTGFTGQTVGEAMPVNISLNEYQTFNADTYNVTEFAVRSGATAPSFLETDKTAQVLWRILDSDDALYDSSTTCFEFRYRKDKDVTDSDETETICAEKTVSAETLAFTPYGG